MLLQWQELGSQAPAEGQQLDRRKAGLSGFMHVGDQLASGLEVRAVAGAAAHRLILRQLTGWEVGKIWQAQGEPRQHAATTKYASRLHEQWYGLLIQGGDSLSPL